MRESISEFLKKEKVLLWVKTYDYDEVEKAITNNLDDLDSKKFYIYNGGKTVNKYTGESLGTDNLFDTFDRLYPQGIRKTPVFLLIKEGLNEILQRNNLEYIKEIIETKKESPKYNFTIIIADTENVPQQLDRLSDFIDKQVLENEKGIVKYVSDLLKLEKIDLTLEEVNKAISDFKDSLRKLAGKEEVEEQLKQSNFENMMIVSGGKYKPSFADEEKEVFDIEVGKYPVTQELYEKIMRTNPSNFEGSKKPVEWVTWWEALEFCNKLSEKYGLQPVYDLSGSSQGLLMINQLNGEKTYPDIANFKNTEGFRLPTEVEWEWFARGGEIARRNGSFELMYPGSNDVNEVAWYEKNSNKETHDVGLKKPNQLGLYDCSGNVWEWCYDTSDIVDDGFKTLEKGKKYTYTAFDAENVYRRLRGGSWINFIRFCETTNRGISDATAGSGIIGFRFVRTI